MTVGSQEYDWNLDLGQIAVIWRGGCIIRAAFLDRIRAAYENNAELPTLLTDEDFSKVLADAQEAWRNVVATAVRLGIPVPDSPPPWPTTTRCGPNACPRPWSRACATSSARTRTAVRDCDGTFHTLWAQDRSEKSRS